MQNLFLVFILIFAPLAHSANPDKFNQKNTRYRTSFGQCPSKSSGMFSLIVMKEFEKNRSLKDVKEKIIAEKLDEKYFLSDYKISYNPVIRQLKIKLECPGPIAKVQVYKLNGEEQYSAILGDNGRMYEPGYENLLRAEKRLTTNLPMLAMSLEQLNSDAPTEITDLLNKMNKDFRGRISEIMISKNNDLTIVFALGARATSVFMGADFWEEKLEKLEKIVGYVSKDKRYPTSINLMNAKKVVVKFSDNI